MSTCQKDTMYILKKTDFSPNRSVLIVHISFILLSIDLILKWILFVYTVQELINVELKSIDIESRRSKSALGIRFWERERERK